MEPTRFPLQWPSGWTKTPPSHRQYTPFKSGRSQLTRTDALRRLEDELRRINGRNPILSTNWPLRIDGSIRLDQSQPADPGAAVYFIFKGNQRVLACDRYTTVEGNIAAIAMHIRAIRAIERYGVGSLEQALAGYRALPANASQWWEVLGFTERQTDWEKVQDSYLKLARQYHPDVSPTGEIAMAKINAARDAARIDLDVAF